MTVLGNSLESPLSPSTPDSLEPSHLSGSKLLLHTPPLSTSAPLFWDFVSGVLYGFQLC